MAFDVDLFDALLAGFVLGFGFVEHDVKEPVIDLGFFQLGLGELQPDGCDAGDDGEDDGDDAEGHILQLDAFDDGDER